MYTLEQKEKMLQFLIGMRIPAMGNHVPLGEDVEAELLSKQ